MVVVLMGTMCTPKVHTDILCLNISLGTVVVMEMLPQEVRFVLDISINLYKDQPII